MALPRKTRGEYRPLYEALATGRRFLAFSPDAKLLFYTLKLLCGVAGIRTWPGLESALVELTGCAPKRVRTGLDELIVAGWVVHEAPVVWVVRGLEHEPQVSHGEKHRKWIANALAGLPDCATVDAFRAHYREFLPPASEAVPESLRDTLSDRHADSPTHTPYGTKPQPQPTPQPTPLPQPQPATSNPADRDQRCVLLTAAANRGIDERYGEQPAPLRWNAAGANEVVTALESAGVDTDFAAAVIFAYARTLTLDRPPKSLKYFTQHVLDRWTADAARRAAQAFAPGALPVVAPPAEGDQLRYFATKYARDGDAEWQQYCDERQIAWRAA